jgi:hypothetical protein
VLTATVDGALCVAARALVGVRELNRVIGADAGTDFDAVLAWYGGAEHIVSEAPRHGRSRGGR